MTSDHLLAGTRVLEIADERAEFIGMSLAGLGADVVKLEPVGGSSSRRLPPFAASAPDASLFFWHFNRGKRSVVIDPAETADLELVHRLAARADIILLNDVGWFPLGAEALRELAPHAIVATLRDFGADGPWRDYVATDLIHLALGGQTKQCGYDPLPDGTYDTPPIAPQFWHSYQMAGEQLLMGILGAVYHRARGGGGQLVEGSVHEAAAKNIEMDVNSWIYLRTPLYRQTARHAGKRVSDTLTIVHTKDGRWFTLAFVGNPDLDAIRRLFEQYGMGRLFPERSEAETPSAGTGQGRPVPGSSGSSAVTNDVMTALQRFFRRFTYETAPWQFAQEAGIMCSPIRRPHENLADEHWWSRRTFAKAPGPDGGDPVDVVVGKWLATETEWRIGGPAPALGADRESVEAELAAGTDLGRTLAPAAARKERPAPSRWALDGVRILDFSWFLASAGGTRFLAAMGAESLKVEWSGNPDTRVAIMAPVGGRAAREAADAPLKGVRDTDMSGQFNNKNAGKRGLSLNLRHPRGLELARRLVAVSDVVAEGFSPGVLDRLGLGYEELRRIKPDIIYASQSGTGASRPHELKRAVGPIAQALSGLTDMSGLPSPALPAGWGYSYLDWIGAYSFASSILGALTYRERTGRGQWIDASQVETGIYLTGVQVLDWSVNGRGFERNGNRSAYGASAPQGIYRCAGDDAWIAVECASDAQWAALAPLIGLGGEHPTLPERLAAHDEIDRRIGEWTRARDAWETMALLQSHGIPAGVCQNGEELVDRDPQLKHLRWLTEVTGTKIGTWPVAEAPFRMSATPPYIGGRLDRGAPGYGEDNEYVYGELLGLSTREIAQLAEDGVI